jgi:hypothetical protein
MKTPEQPQDALTPEDVDTLLTALNEALIKVSEQADEIARLNEQLNQKAP